MGNDNNQVVDINELVDIRDVVIDTTKPVNERIEDYNRQIGNPRCFRYGDTIVHVSFAENGPSLKDCLIQYLKSGQSADFMSI